MKASDIFYKFGDAVSNSGYDRELTQDEQQELKDMADGLELPVDVETALAETGAVIDGWSLPIGTCLIMWIRGIFGN